MLNGTMKLGDAEGQSAFGAITNPNASLTMQSTQETATSPSQDMDLSFTQNGGVSSFE